MKRRLLMTALLAAAILTNCQCGGKGGALRSAAGEGDLDKVKQLVEAGADVNAADMLGNTALHLAAQNGHIDIVEFLVEKNADVNAKDNYGATPLDFAKSKNHKDVMNFLRREGGKTAKELR